MSEGTKARRETRLMSMQDLVEMAANYFTNVDLVKLDASTHSRFNRVEVNAAVEGAAEALIVATN